MRKINRKRSSSARNNQRQQLESPKKSPRSVRIGGRLPIELRKRDDTSGANTPTTSSGASSTKRLLNRSINNSSSSETATNGNNESKHQPKKSKKMRFDDEEDKENEIDGVITEDDDDQEEEENAEKSGGDDDDVDMTCDTDEKRGKKSAKSRKKNNARRNQQRAQQPVLEQSSMVDEHENNQLNNLKYVDVRLPTGKEIRFNTYHNLGLIYDDPGGGGNDEPPPSGQICNGDKPTTVAITSNQQASAVQLPKVNIELMPNNPICYDRYKLPINYIKYLEKTNEELDEEVEYDMDEEDNVWLNIINEQRQTKSTPDKPLDPITQDEFELLMDRLEKESYFQSSANSNNASSSKSNANTSKTSQNESMSNEDALCCICLDGECVNSNVILFCDMCNLAVHQECYGVPYIPEGQWLCRRCIQSPSAPVSCILCPNKYGAFKQTDTGEWAHVVCAIWIPEVHFANTVFLEPIIGIDCIDKARWKLMCFICRKRNVGACIQCDKANCYTAFHVTCAQQAGLFMNFQEEHDETLNTTTNRRKKALNKSAHHNDSTIANGENGADASSLVEVRKRAYCELHTPIDVLSPKTRREILKSGAYNSVEYEEALKRAKRNRMKKARKLLAERRNAPPVISLPVLPAERIEDIKSKVIIDDMETFFPKLMNYWLLKRYSRNGVPLLRRLQNSAIVRKHNDPANRLHQAAAAANTSSQGTETAAPTEDTTAKTTPTKGTPKKTDDSEYKKLKEQLTYCKKLRMDLEKARLLMELIRKRERFKRDLVRISKLISVYELNPFNGVFLQQVLNSLVELDKSCIFTQPVDPVSVPSYYDVIKHPMDFSKMQSKIDQLAYCTFEQFENDFRLIINNCYQFNPKTSVFYRAAFRLKEKASVIFKQAKKMVVKLGFEEDLKSFVVADGTESQAGTNLDNLSTMNMDINSVKTDDHTDTNTDQNDDTLSNNDASKADANDSNDFKSELDQEDEEKSSTTAAIVSSTRKNANTRKSNRLKNPPTADTSANEVDNSTVDTSSTTKTSEQDESTRPRRSSRNSLLPSAIESQLKRQSTANNLAQVKESSFENDETQPAVEPTQRTRHSNRLSNLDPGPTKPAKSQSDADTSQPDDLLDNSTNTGADTSRAESTLNDSQKSTGVSRRTAVLFKRNKSGGLNSTANNKK